MDTKKIENGMRLILEGIGENTLRDGLQKTPERVAAMCAEIFCAAEKQLSLTPLLEESGSDGDMICVRDIAFYSVCEHHFLPFFGKISICYQPAGNRIAGFSTLGKIVDHYSRRLQLQERLTANIADELMTYLKPKGVMVISKATQLCVSMRGEHRKEAASTITRAIRGTLAQERAEWLLRQ